MTELPGRWLEPDVSRGKVVWPHRCAATISSVDSRHKGEPCARSARLEIAGVKLCALHAKEHLLKVCVAPT